MPDVIALSRQTCRYSIIAVKIPAPGEIATLTKVVLKSFVHAAAVCGCLRTRRGLDVFGIDREFLPTFLLVSRSQILFVSAALLRNRCSKSESRFRNGEDVQFEPRLWDGEDGLGGQEHEPLRCETRCVRRLRSIF